MVLPDPEKRLPMDDYPSPKAVLKAISDIARRRARSDGVNANAIIQLEYRNRLLARIFSHEEAPWVLKGGTSTLIRLPDARTTKDIDLLHEGGSLESAVEELRDAAERDLGDYFRFTLRTVGPLVGGEERSSPNGAALSFEVTCGPTQLNRISVDLVVSQNPLVGDVETRLPPSAPHMPRLPHSLYRLYPLDDHVADKACAMVELHVDQRPSTRSKDLVDIVTFASTQSFHQRTLRRAITAEANFRGLSDRGFAERIPADQWALQYATAAARIPHCRRHPSVDDAVSLVRSFIDEALADHSKSRTWNPQKLSWD